MNLNQSLINKRRPKINRNEPAASTFKVQQVMGPPLTPALKRKSLSTPSSATNWGRSRQNISNSVMRSASSTVSTSETESRSIIALTEGRGDARCEVGIASRDLSLPTLILCQISDGQSYINTLTKINILNPTDLQIETNKRHPLFGQVKDYIMNTLVKQKYLQMETDPVSKKITFSWGVREKEISKHEVLKFVCKVYKDHHQPKSWTNQYKNAQEQGFENDKLFEENAMDTD